jgi:hypothetical protein
MKTSIEQAKRAFDSFASTSEKTWKSLETTSQSARVKLLGDRAAPARRLSRPQAATRLAEAPAAATRTIAKLGR